MQRRHKRACGCRLPAIAQTLAPAGARQMMPHLWRTQNGKIWTVRLMQNPVPWPNTHALRRQNRMSGRMQGM